MIDTADIYGNKGGSESFLGEVLEGRRDRVVLATKFGGDMGDGTQARGSRDYIRKAVDARCNGCAPTTSTSTSTTRLTR